jgi:hypothetical protein
MGLESSVTCDYPGCGAVRREVNRWYVVYKDAGVHVYPWDECPSKAMKEGKHLCGIGHTIQTVSNLLTPDTTKSDRESTLELKPPLKRDGTASAESKEITETLPGEPEKEQHGERVDN